MSLSEAIWPLFFPLLGAVIALVQIRREKKAATFHRKLEILLMWQLVIGIGLSFLSAATGHLFFSDQVAQSIGWPPGSPFQKEVGMWDGAIGILGILCLKFRDDFWLATIIGSGLFLFSAGLWHAYQLVVNGDISPSNAGGVLWVDILFPVLLGILYYLWRRESSEKHSLR